MKLEYLPDHGFHDTPLVRLFDFGSAEASSLRSVFARLATQSILSIELHRADFIHAVNGCRLTLTVDGWDQGLAETGEPIAFRCALTPKTWDNIEGLTQPFTKGGSHGFQWLTAIDIPLLLSHDGRW